MRIRSRIALLLAAFFVLGFLFAGTFFTTRRDELLPEGIR
jgi:hypothetical protein